MKTYYRADFNKENEITIKKTTNPYDIASSGKCYKIAGEYYAVAQTKLQCLRILKSGIYQEYKEAKSEADKYRARAVIIAERMKELANDK